MTQADINAFFSGQGGKSWSWAEKPLGTSISGVIKMVHPPRQVTDPITKELKVRKDGSPQMQVRIDLQTQLRDPSDPEDDGMRGLYVGGWMTGAVGDAIRKAGVEGGPQVGGQLAVVLTERTPNPEIPAAKPTNKFVAQYTPPSPAGNFFAQPQYAQPQAPAQQGYFPPQQPPQQIFPPQAQQAYPPQQPPQQAQYPPNVVQQPQYAPQQQYVQQAPPVNQVAPPQQPEPPKPAVIDQATWDQMPAQTKIDVATTMAAMPGAQLQSPGEPGF